LLLKNYFAPNRFANAFSLRFPFRCEFSTFSQFVLRSLRALFPRGLLLPIPIKIPRRRALPGRCAET
jgi:hypothetical protein